MSIAKNGGAIECIQGLMEEFDYNQFRYTGQMLIKLIEDSDARSGESKEEEKGSD
jgi:hypothetical protein